MRIKRVRSVTKIFASVAYHAAQGCDNPLELSAKAAVKGPETGPSRSVRGPADVKCYEKTHFDVFRGRAGHRCPGGLCDPLVLDRRRRHRPRAATRTRGFG